MTSDARGTSMHVSESIDPSGVVTLTVTGEVDLSTAAALRTAVQDALALKPGALVFDLAGLTFLDSSGIGALLSAVGSVDTVQVRNPSDIVRRVIELSGLAQILGMTGAAG